MEALLLEASEASLVRRTVKEWKSKLAGALVSGWGRRGEARRGSGRGGGRCMQQGALVMRGRSAVVSLRGQVFVDAGCSSRREWG